MKRVVNRKNYEQDPQIVEDKTRYKVVETNKAKRKKGKKP